MVRLTSFLPRFAIVAALVAGLTAVSSATPAATQSRLPERFTAIAIPPGTSGPPTPVDIVIERWSTPEEDDRIRTAILELGTKGIISVLLKLPRVGSFATTGAAGYPIRYAWRVKTPDGLERITLATDRAMGFIEASEQARSSDYPVTLVDIRLMPSGTGEGTVYVAAKIAIDRLTRLMTVENYDFQPLLLKNVKRQR